MKQSYDAISAANLKQNNVKIDKEGEGTERIKVGGKEYETKWTKLKTTSGAGGVTVISEFKMWFSKQVPLSGLVKMETTTSGLAMTLELTGSGSK